MTHRVAITGGHGFLGWHLRARLQADQPQAEVAVLGRGDLDDADSLADRIAGCRVVYHLAAVNSHDPQAASANVLLAEQLVAGLARLSHGVHVVFASSTHIERNTPYGASKRRAAEVLDAWARSSGSSVADVVLPNLFGECGRPRYNSAVATFCDDVINGSPPQINASGSTELLHAQDAAQALLRHSGAGATGERLTGTNVRILDLYDQIARMYESYAGSHRVPPLTSRLELQLFNQLRTAMFPAAYPVVLQQHADSRGAFFEAVRAHEGGQTSFSTTHPGVTRGDHWHFEKIERFLVLAGAAQVCVRRLFDHQIHRFEVDGAEPAFIDMPPLHTHAITNRGDGDLLTMFWSNDHFNPAEPDTFHEPVDAEVSR